MSFWPSKCPVCEEELPARGNRRVYVPWKRGFRLVHVGACFEAIDSQGVLDLEPKREQPNPRLLVLARRAVAECEAEAVKRVQQVAEGLSPAARRRLARLAQVLARDEGVNGSNQVGEYPRLSHEQRLELCRRLVAHFSESCAPARTEVPF